MKGSWKFWWVNFITTMECSYMLGALLVWSSLYMRTCIYVSMLELMYSVYKMIKIYSHITYEITYRIHIYKISHICIYPYSMHICIKVHNLQGFSHEIEDVKVNIDKDLQDVKLERWEMCMSLYWDTCIYAFISNGTFL